MRKPNILAHCSYIGTTGYNNHSRDFFRQIHKHFNLKVRNFTVGKNWRGIGDRKKVHDNENYLTEIDKKILHKQTLIDGNGDFVDFDLYNNGEHFKNDINIILNETDHNYFYHKYDKPKIAYNVWESTRQPENFFNKLKEFDEIWVPSEWQRKCTIDQGMDPDKVQVVPEGVDVKTFYPDKITNKPSEYNDGRFKFILFGRWDYRKSTKEIIETFLSTFKNNEPVDLVVSIENPYAENIDGFKTTEERLKYHKLSDNRIKILHFPDRDDYIKYLKTGHIFLSCARSEGWNLPLIEAMACGIPSIHSNNSGQLEFASGKGHPVKNKGLIPTGNNSYYNFAERHNTEIPGNYYEPDFNDLSKVMRNVYENYEKAKEKALNESIEIREKFNWDRVGKIGKTRIEQFWDKINLPYYESPGENKIYYSFINGAKVEILGDDKKEYQIEFFDENNKIIHSERLFNNMWTQTSRKWFTPWKIKINGKNKFKLYLTNKKVLISLESKSIGDTIAWAPYAVKFSEKHNCKVILSTFHNEWFKNLKYYKNIEFINPGEQVDYYANYSIGWYKDENGKWSDYNKNPNQVNRIPLQKTATDILGLECEELRTDLDFKQTSKKWDKYVAIAPHSTAQLKYWNNETGWSEVINFLNKKGYKVVNVSYEKFDVEGVINLEDVSWDETMSVVKHSDFFIGLSSGLSWVAWALKKPVVMISNFSEYDHEFTSNVIRITNENVCHGCWNDVNETFDPGDWNWCPFHKNTDRQFECHKKITGSQVIQKIKDNLL